MKKISSKNVDMGNRLKSFRLKRGISVEMTAQLINVAPSTYREWEKGRAITGNPYVELAEVLGVSVYEILGIEDEARQTLSHCLNELEKSIQMLRKYI